jgi:pyrimidine operon attenuation protein / uracil phosphoribosyltransferase
MQSTTVLNTEAANKKLNRMALEIAERNYAENEITLLGIKDSGLVIAKIIAAALATTFKGTISLYELALDKKKPMDILITPAANFNGKTVILIDDVANSGKTMLYAMKPLLQQFPKKIQTLALVERTHKIFPVAVDYVGLSVSTTPDQHIYVDVAHNEVKMVRMEGEG